MIDVQELRALDERATDGPWFQGYQEGELWNGDSQSGHKIWPDHLGVGRLIAQTGVHFTGWIEQDAANAALIVAMRNALPALLDAAEARDAAGARVAKLCEALADMIPGPLCGDSFVPPIPDTKFLSLDGMTWGKLRRARQVLKEVGYVE